MLYENYQFLWLISLAGTLSIFMTRAKCWIKAAVAGFYTFGFLTVVPGYHFYGHYFLQWIPAVCLSAAAFIYTVEEVLILKFNLKISAKYLILTTLLLFSFIHLNAMKSYYFRPHHTEILRQAYKLNPFPESKIIADKLNTLMKPEDKLVVFGNEVQMYFYTNKLSPSRFACPGWLLEFTVSKSEEWQKEFISDVEKAAPEYLVFYSNPTSWMINPKANNLIFPWLDKFISNYNLIGFADIFNDETVYVWMPDLDLAKNSPRSMYKIFVFKRKS